MTVGLNLRRENEVLRRKSAFESLVLGFFYMNRPIEYLEGSVGKKCWCALEKIWRVVESDYELRKRRNEFCVFFCFFGYAGLSVISNAYSLRFSSFG